MTSQPPPTDPPPRPSINQASRRYRGAPGRNVTPSPRPSPVSAGPMPAAPLAATPSEPCPDRRLHDRRLLFLHRLRYAAVTLALMVATGATVALICTHG
ncbi:hypothetical protein J2S43_008181 [Catenuloplanes nepalensis]|uniref:Uncharacterized protein n=1 Tax=Catenuloplanes nepalensis TaxID=587533 RepID=A0ABT9N7J8_9ACTN|nr:hypothetical protein [Catenuloplanes nepalensis]MDP9799669.1 hypothetical protein [Catenuloplanes nepalensis]